jgi:hypothetical protein
MIDADMLSPGNDHEVVVMPYAGLGPRQLRPHRRIASTNMPQSAKVTDSLKSKSSVNSHVSSVFQRAFGTAHADPDRALSILIFAIASAA